MRYTTLQFGPKCTSTVRAMTQWPIVSNGPPASVGMNGRQVDSRIALLATNQVGAQQIIIILILLSVDQGMDHHQK